MILWRRGLNWSLELATVELGISRTSLVKYEDGETEPRAIQLATVALTLKAEWTTMSKDGLLRQLKYEVLRIDHE